MLLLLVMVVHPQKAMSAMAMAMDMDMDGVDTKDYADNTSAIIYVCTYILCICIWRKESPLENTNEH